MRRSLAAATLMVFVAAIRPQDATRYDVVVLGGTVLDGTGGPARRADVGIRDGRIVRLGDLGDVPAALRLDATGLIVAPGFIDLHTHADDVADRPLAPNFVRMGVTSIVAGNCGTSALDVGGALARIATTGTAVNFGTLVGHNTVRTAVLGTAQRGPTPSELTRMKGLVWRAMVDGALGFSTGLQYVPGTYADAVEIIELAKVAGSVGGLYASHMRNEGTLIEEAVAEAIQVGEAAACPVQISHLKIDSPSRWGQAARVLELLDAARARGIDVRADQYVYTAASSSLSIRFPAWALEGGADAVAARLDDDATWNRIAAEMRGLLAERGLDDLSFAVVARYEPDPSVQGLSIAEIATKWRGANTLADQLEVARAMLRAGGARMVYHLMSEEDVVAILRHPHVSVASDSSVLAEGDGVPHPRGYGNNARVLGRFVREGVVTLAEAVRKMTSLPASHFGFADRGVIDAGFAADLVVFDRLAIADPASYTDPHRFAAGIAHVLVNGTPVVRDGRHTGARPGVVLRSARVTPEGR